MAEVMTMPRMSDTMEEGNILGWLKKVGDDIEPGDVLAEVETDKATMELESPYEGKLLYIGVKEGSIAINAVLAVIGEEGEDYAADLAAAEAEAKAEAGGSSDDPTPNEKAADNTAESENSNSKSNDPNESGSKNNDSKESGAGSKPEKPAQSDEHIKASPLAKSIAKEAGISLANVTGTGDNGRIIKRDIEEYIESGATGPSGAPGAQIIPNGEAFKDEPISQMRKTIARRLAESKFGAPHFYLTMEINMGKSVDARARMNEVSEVRISYNDMIVKASALALRKHPNINSSWLGDKIRRNGNINIGVAVAVADGLLVPVINNADFKSLANIKTEVKDLAGKAKEKKLSMDEMSGNTFTISNLGMFDIDEFTAIINPPDACILAVGSIVEKAIVVEGEIQIGHIMKVTLSCDHRVVDGASGAAFLQTLKEYLEDPVRMLI